MLLGTQFKAGINGKGKLGKPPMTCPYSETNLEEFGNHPQSSHVSFGS